jgi:hypothetical protein
MDEASARTSEVRVYMTGKATQHVYLPIENNKDKRRQPRTWEMFPHRHTQSFSLVLSSPTFKMVLVATDQQRIADEITKYVSTYTARNNNI